MILKHCNSCGKDKPLNEFHKAKNTKDGHYTICKTCKINKTKKWRRNNKKHIKEYKKSYHRANPAYSMFRGAKRRADIHNIPFDLELDDIVIPEICPVLGIPIKVGENGWNDNSPTLDRIIPELGYVKGNIIVVSFRANRIKNDATITELKQVAEFYGNYNDTKTRNTTKSKNTKVDRRKWRHGSKSLRKRYTKSRNT